MSSKPSAAEGSAVLDRSSSVPLRIQLRDLLQREITQGAYEAGELFPTEREIAERYHVSRTTIREALTDLVRVGFLIRQQGKGTFVARSTDVFDATQLSSFSEDMLRRGLVAGARLVAFDEGPPGEEARGHFGSHADTVWRIYRLRLADDEPIALQTSYLPAGRFDFTTEEIAAGSLYRVLEARHGVFVASADEVISAAVADAEQAELLGVEPGTALLCVDRYAFSQSGEPVEFVRIQYRADRYKFFVHQSRGG